MTLFKTRENNIRKSWEKKNKIDKKKKKIIKSLHTVLNENKYLPCLIYNRLMVILL